MGFLGRVVEFIFWVVVATWVVRGLFAWLGGTRLPRQAHQPPADAPRVLQRDPWCGTYVAPEISQTLEQAGQTLYFCSTECRTRYLASQRAAGA